MELGALHLVDNGGRSISLTEMYEKVASGKSERRHHFKEKMSLEEAHHHRRPWIRAWRKKEMNEGRGREEKTCTTSFMKNEVLVKFSH